MEEDADVEVLTFDECIALYWQNPKKAMQDLIASLKKYYPLQESSDYVPLGNEAEQRYRELALESCDIIDLANLPESDRHIATQKLALRRLYVALRVQVEIASSAQAGETELEAIEKRRNAIQRQLAGWGKPDKDKREDKGNRVPIGERLAKAQRLVVLGDPGAGKTTMVRWIATAYLLKLKRDLDWKDLPDVSTLPDKDWLPIIVRCRDLDPSSLSGSLDDILGHTLRKAEMTVAECTALRELLQKKLQEGEALLLLDGLDEITDPAIRVRFCRQIEQICIAYSKAPIIATSRIVGYREMGYRIGRGFEHVTVADLSREDKDDFARRWCEVTELPERREDGTKELIKDIHSADRIERLTGNPMLLTTMALIKRKVGKLPSRRAKLYEEAVEVLLNWRSEVDDPIDSDEAFPQLEYIAYAMCDRGVQQLREDEVIDLFARIRTEYPNVHAAKQHEPREFLSLLERRTGILVETGHLRHNGRTVPVFEFRHLTFQEYLAGLALVAGHFPNRKRSLSLAEYVAPLAARMSEVQDTEVAVTENWREALRLCVASCNDDDVDDVLQAILQPLEGEDAQITARPRAVLAALCLADEPNASNEKAREVLQEFVRQVGENDGKHSAKTSIDIAAMELATSRWGQLLRSLLVKEFRKQDASLRLSYGGLCKEMATASVPDHEAIIPEWYVKQVSRLNSSEEVEAIEAAFDIGKMAELAFLSHIFSTKYQVYRNQVLIVPGVVNRLLEMLLSSASASHAASEALKWLNLGFGNKDRWKPTLQQKRQLISFISNPASDPQACTLLSQILNTEGEGGRAVEPLLAILDNSDKNVRQAVASALGQIGDERAVAPLIAKLDDSDKYVRQAVASALGQIGDERAVAPLIAKLDDSDKYVRQAVAEALGQIGNERAVAPLIAKLDDSDKYVQRAVASALGRIGDEQAVAPLIAKLDDSNKDVQPAVAEALGRIGDGQAVAPLIAKLDDSNKDVRQVVVEILGRIGDERAVAPLIVKLDDSDKDVRQAVASALGQIKDERAVAPLIAKLDDSDKYVQRAVASALGQIGDEQTVALLIAKLDDSDKYVQPAVASALGQIKDERAVAPLIAKLDDSDKDVRQAVAEALGQIGDEQAVAPLIAKLDDSDKDVRQAVASALGQIKDERAVAPLIAKLNDSNKDVRQAVVEILGQIKDEQAVAPLIAKLDDSDKYVRQAVASALGQIGDERAVAPLIAKLDDSDKYVRQAVASALGQIGNERAVAPLIAKLDDSDKDVQPAVASALGQIGDERAVSPLIAKLDDSNKYVQRAVASALGQIGDEQAVAPLIAKLDDSDKYVQQAVASALGQIGDERAVSPLIVKLDDSNKDVQQAVASALGQIGDERAVSPLIVKLDDSNKDVRQAVEEALVRLGHEQTIKTLLERLLADIRYTRVAALRALSRTCEDEIDRKLLSRDLDALNPFLDPQKEINEKWVRHAAKSLKMSVEEVRNRYQALGQKFSLNLNFSTNDS
jgi:HEAT repeat protein